MKLPAIRQLPSGNWFCQLRLDGKSISITEPTREKCQARAMAYKTGVLQIRNQPLSITLGAACDAYIAARVGVLKPSALDGYYKIRAQYFQSIMGLRLSDLTARRLSQAVQRERQRVSRRGKPLSPKTIQNALGFIKCVLNEYGVTLDGKVTAPEVKQSMIVLPDPEKVIQAIVGSEIELPCLLAAWLSLSMSELRGLTKSKSIRDGKLYMLETVVRVRDREAEKRQKNKDGSVPKNPGIYKDVRESGGDAGKEEKRPRAFDIPPYIARLINQVEGDILVPYSVRQLERRFDNLLKSHGLPHMTFHQLRHLNASIMAMLGIQKEIAQQRGGWKTPYTMNRVYTHVFDVPRQEADKKINAFFDTQIANNSLTNPRKRRVYRLHTPQ